MKPQLPTTVAFVAFLTAGTCLPAQQEWNRARAIAEITELTTKDFPHEQWPERNAKMKAWLERVEKTRLDLGDHAFTKAIPLYLNGERDRAGEVLFRTLAKQAHLPSDKFDRHVGRILMAYTWNTIRDDNLDLARKVEPVALRFSQDRSQVYRLIANTLKRAPSKSNTAYLNEVLSRMLSDKHLDDSQKQALLEGLYGTPRRRAGRAGGRAAPARARRARATTIKPFEAKSLDGQEISIRKLAGKVVLVDFWATWCGPCIRKMPGIVNAHKEFSEQGLVVIGVSLDKEPGQKRGGELIPPDPKGETTGKIRAAMKKLGMDWPVIYEGGGWDTRLAKENGIRAIPATFLIDRKGKVRYSNPGEDDLKKRIRELLAEGRQQQRRY